MILKPNGGLYFAHAQVQHVHWLLPEFPREWWSAYRMLIRRRTLSIPLHGAMCYRGEISAQREMLRFRHRYSGDPSATAESGAGCVWCLVVPVAEVGALRCVLQRSSLQENEKRAGGWRHVEHFPSRPLQGSSFALKIFLNKQKLVNGQFFKELFPPLAPSACHSGWRPCGAELS